MLFSALIELGLLSVPSLIRAYLESGLHSPGLFSIVTHLGT